MIEIQTYDGMAPSHGLNGKVTSMVKSRIVKVIVDGSIWIEEPEPVFKLKLMALSKKREP